MNRLTHVESQRIIALLDETIQRIQIVSLVKDFGLSQPDFTEMLPIEVVNDIRTHKLLEESFLEHAGNRKLEDVCLKFI